MDPQIRGVCGAPVADRSDVEPELRGQITR